jgi:type VI secretion system secreted protein VgrG
MVMKRKYTQQNRRIAVSTPLGEDVLLLKSIQGTEAISQPFHYGLELLSEEDSLNFDDLVGQRVSIRTVLADGSNRYWNGFVSRFSQGERDQILTAYRADVVPWLWFLGRTADCRIFQNKTVPDIIQQIFRDLGFTDFTLRLYGSFRTRDYCVQYRETDFAFVSRLMEEEGIYYFFEHGESQHRMVLANDPSAHKPCPGQEKARCLAAANSWKDEDVILGWHQAKELRPGKWTHTDYNFETPSTSLLVNVAGPNQFEIYDYPGEYSKRGEGESLAKIRLQEETAPAFVGYASGNCRSFFSGALFTLEDHYREDLNQQYLITAMTFRASQGGDYGSGGMDNLDPEFAFEGNFECIPAIIPFRPLRVSPRPSVRGCQTAVVVGPAGEEIYTDKYGRVKVQFHWDHEGKKNENSSCWVRCSHPWAGVGWGAVSIPRIGQEVVVDFLEGDPDQPIIIGRVYNAEAMPPYGLPASAVISGVKSNSTKGGGGYNEIILDDTKGNELIRIHGQYDEDITIEHDERVKIGNDRTENVGHNETITIGNDRTEKVINNENITVGVNRTEQVGSNEKISIGSNRTETVGSNEMVTVALTRTHNVGINDMLNVGAAQEVTVGGAQAVTVGLARAVTVGLAQQTSIGRNMSTDVAKDMTTKVGKNFSLEAGESIVLKTGEASITLKKDGTILVEGKNIKISGSGKIVAEAQQIDLN